MKLAQHRIQSLVALVLAFAAFLPGAIPAPAAPPEPTGSAPSASPVKVLRSDDQGIVVEVVAPAPTLAPVTVNGEPFQQVEMAGFEREGAAGAPALPMLVLPLGVPHNRDLSVSITPLEVETLKQAVRPAPMEGLRAVYADGALEADPLALPLRVEPTPAFDPAAYTVKGWSPAETARVGERGLFRDQPFAQVIFQPFQVDLTTGVAQVIRRARIEVRFGAETQALGETGSAADDPYLGELNGTTLLNADQAERWRLNGPASGADRSVVAAPGPRWRVTVTETGIHRLTRAQLQAAGVPTSALSPSTFRLERAAPTPVVVPVRLVVDGGDGLINTVEFFVNEVGNRWANSAVYWISQGTPSPAMTTRAAAPAGGTATQVGVATTKVERQTLYASRVSGYTNGEVWFIDQAFSPGQTRSVAFTLDGVSNQAGNAALTVRSLAGRATRTSIQYGINGTAVSGIISWPGYTVNQTTVTFPNSVLQSGNNTFTMTIPVTDTNSQVLLDWFSVTYLRALNAVNNQLDFSLNTGGDQDVQVGSISGSDVVVFDVSNPDAPVALTGVTVSAGSARFRATGATGTRYAVSGTPKTATIAAWQVSDLKNSQNGADYIILSHPNFVSAIDPLRAHYVSKGMRVSVVTTQQVYDEFGDGTMNPEWIRNFFAYAYNSWTAPRPAFALLVGDGTYDPLRWLGRSTETFIPPYLGNYDIYIGETAADNRFVTVSGSDNIPDLALGRLPVNTAAETTAIVNKILGYEAGRPVPGQAVGTNDWRRRFFLVTDNPDAAGNFYEFSDSSTENFPSDVQVRKMYTGIDVCADASCGPQAQQKVVEGINAENLIVQYIGHAERNVWAFDPIIFQRSNLASLTNQNLPFMLPWTCWTGYFIDPNPTYFGLDEDLLRKVGSGSIGSFGPTGKDVATGHDLLTQGFYDLLFNEQHTRLGELSVASKVRLFNGSEGYRRLLDTYVLLGDPALHLNAPGCMLFKGDVDCDCQVDVSDLQAVASDWHKPTFNPRHNLNDDTVVNVLDIQIAAQQWGLTCPTD